ncbi:MAG: hypothetical protein ACRBDI_03450 [Alphaproteobacteria bacterium]
MRKIAPSLDGIQNAFQDSTKNYVAIVNEHKVKGKSYLVREMPEGDFDIVMRDFAHRAGINPVIHDDNLCVFERKDFDGKSWVLATDLSNAFSFVKMNAQKIQEYLHDESEARRLGKDAGMVKLNYE